MRFKIIGVSFLNRMAIGLFLTESKVDWTALSEADESLTKAVGDFKNFAYQKGIKPKVALIDGTNLYREIMRKFGDNPVLSVVSLIVCDTPTRLSQIKIKPADITENNSLDITFPGKLAQWLAELCPPKKEEEPQLITCPFCRRQSTIQCYKEANPDSSLFKKKHKVKKGLSAPMNHNKPLTREALTKIESLYRLGRSPKSIARATGRTAQAISSIIGDHPEWKTYHRATKHTVSINKEKFQRDVLVRKLDNTALCKEHNATLNQVMRCKSNLRKAGLLKDKEPINLGLKELPKQSYKKRSNNENSHVICNEILQ